MRRFESEVVVLRDEPYCAETRLDLQDGCLTPASRFFSRNNFLLPSDWPGLTIDGAVERTQRLGVADLDRLPTTTLVATLECAGNGRAFMHPSVAGEQWQLGGVSTAEWRGISLANLLESAGVRPDTVEIQFSGSDGFARSLPIETALAAETILATGMNGNDLPRVHGGPVRLLVPGWYGMSAVKWVTRIAALTEPFRGHYQVDRYVIGDRPIREMEVRSVITAPIAHATVRNPINVRGLAWTGHGVVAAVDVTNDGCRSWFRATLIDSPTRFAWVRWECKIDVARSGPLDLLSRAEDSEGRVQPVKPVWNSLGYCNNTATTTPINIARSSDR